MRALPWALQGLLLVVVALAQPASDRVESGVSLFPHNLTHCLFLGLTPSLCGHFHAFDTSGCNATTVPAVAFRCLNESRCMGLYGVPACVNSFNFSKDVFNFTACTALAALLNASLDSVTPLLFGNGTGCEYLLRGLDDSATPDAEAGINASALPPPPPIVPRFHPCADALSLPGMVALVDVMRRTEQYTSHVVAALDPFIGPVAGGVSVGVCGVGFTQTNEAVSHLRCRFTDGRYKVDVPAQHIDQHQLRCIAPDFTHFAVGLPHNVSVEVSTGRGESFTANQINFTYYATRPSIDAFGRPMWGYDPTFTRPAWQVAFETNEFGGFTPELYPPSGHVANRGRPSPWDAPQDPFHTRGPAAAEMPVSLDTGDRFEPAADLVMRTRQSALHGIEGSWGDRMSFLRAHSLVRDNYRQDVVAAKRAFKEVYEQTNNGVM